MHAQAWCVLVRQWHCPGNGRQYAHACMQAGTRSDRGPACAAGCSMPAGMGVAALSPRQPKPAATRGAHSRRQAASNPAAPRAPPPRAARRLTRRRPPPAASGGLTRRSRRCLSPCARRGARAAAPSPACRLWAAQAAQAGRWRTRWLPRNCFKQQPGPTPTAFTHAHARPRTPAQPSGLTHEVQRPQAILAVVQRHVSVHVKGVGKAWVDRRRRDRQRQPLAHEVAIHGRRLCLAVQWCSQVRARVCT